MKEFFMTSAIPYWLMFILAVVSVGYCLFLTFRSNDENTPRPITQKLMAIVSGLLLIDALAVLVLYATLGGNGLWWVTGKEIGYVSKLLRVIPLMIFVLVQAAAPFAYKFFMQSYFGEKLQKSLSVKSQFIALVVIVPVALIITRFFPKGTENMWFYIIAGTGLAIAILYSVVNNIRSIGLRAGVVYTVTSFVLCAATLIALLYFIVAFISLIFEMLPIIAAIIGIGVLFSKTFGNAVMRRDDAGNYIATDGTKHSSQSARDTRNQQLHARRNP